MELLNTFIEITLPDSENEERARAAFLKIRETLTRIGIASKGERTLHQSCHIFHKRGRYFITHFKEMMALDGRTVDFSEEDRFRRNTIAALLEEWKLVKIVDPERIKRRLELRDNVKVIHFDEKQEWTLKPHYVVGKKR